MLHTTKKTIPRVKRHSLKEEVGDLHQLHRGWSCDQGLMPDCKVELRKSDNKRGNNPVNKWADVLN